MKRKIILLVACLVATIVAMAQEIDYTGVRIFDPSVHSVQVAPMSNPYLPPVIMMGSDDRINVSFDLLDYDVHYLRYSVYHCDAQWRPSQLVESEWVSGFNQADITDYAQSQATFTHYYNYAFSLPNDEMQLLISGNYLLRVYEQDDPGKVLFQTRFSLCENRVGVQAGVTSRTDFDYNDAHQQLDITLNYSIAQETVSNSTDDVKQFRFVRKMTDLIHYIATKHVIDMSGFFPERIFALGMHAFRSHQPQLYHETLDCEREWHVSRPLKNRILFAVMSREWLWRIGLIVRQAVVRMKRAGR